MNRLPNPSYFLQLSESFIKVAKLVTRGEKPRLVAIRQISSAEMATQSNPLLQLIRENEALPVPVFAVLSVAETIYHTEHFDQIGFSTLTEFIKSDGNGLLSEFELGVFQKSNGMPAPTASPTPLDLVFCGFNSKLIPELADAFPNLDSKPVSLTLSSLDQIRFFKSQCTGDEQVLLVELGTDKSHLILAGASGVEGIISLDIGRQSLYETMAEVLHLHYIGSAIKLFTRSGFDSSEIAPKLGKLFGSRISSAIASEGWNPGSMHITGLLKAQQWFKDSVTKVTGLDSFVIDRSILPFEVGDSVEAFSAMDTEIVSKIYSTLVADEEYSWHSEFLDSLKKSRAIPRREISGSNPPFPTARPDAPAAPLSSAPIETSEPTPPRETVSPYAPPGARAKAKTEEPGQSTPQGRPFSPASRPAAPESEKPEATAHRSSPSSPSGVQNPRNLDAIPEHLLNEIEEYEGEFEDRDDYGGGARQMVIRLILLFLCTLVVGVMVTIVFFPKASEKYLGIRPPHIDFYDSGPDDARALQQGRQGDRPASIEMMDGDVESGVRNLQEQRNEMAFGGLFLPTNPSGATVKIGDFSPRLSPIKLPNVEPGTYPVTITKEGYETETMTVTIFPKQVLKVDTVNLKPVR